MRATQRGAKGTCLPHDLPARIPAFKSISFALALSATHTPGAPPPQRLTASMRSNMDRRLVSRWYSRDPASSSTCSATEGRASGAAVSAAQDA
mgnify:CR=1 FL=1